MITDLIKYACYKHNMTTISPENKLLSAYLQVNNKDKLKSQLHAFTNIVQANTYLESASL